MRRNFEDDTEKNQVGFAKLVLIIIGIIGYAFITFLVLKIIFSMGG